MAGQKFGGIGVPTITRIKVVDEENRLLKKIYVAEKFKAEVVLKALEKSGKTTETVRLKTILLQEFPCRPRRETGAYCSIQFRAIMRLE